MKKGTARKGSSIWGHRHNELLTRIANHSADIRFAKANQWRILYYAVLFLSGVAVAFQQDAALFELTSAKIIGTVVAGVVTLGAILHLLSTKYNLDLYTISSKSLEKMLKNMTRVRRTLDKRTASLAERRKAKMCFTGRLFFAILGDRDRQRRFYTLTFYALFILVVVAVGAVAIAMIWYD